MISIDNIKFTRVASDAELIADLNKFDCPITDANDVAELAKLTAVTDLRLSSQQMTALSLPQLNLTSLTLDMPKLTQLVVPSSVQPSSINLNVADDLDLLTLTNQDQLTHLSISGQGEDKTMNGTQSLALDVQQYPNLTDLTLDNLGSLNAITLTNASKLENLIVRDVPQLDISSADLNPASSLIALKKLELTNTGLTDMSGFNQMDFDSIDRLVFQDNAQYTNLNLLRGASISFSDSMLNFDIEYVVNTTGFELVTNGGLDPSASPSFDWDLIGASEVNGQLEFTAANQSVTQHSLVFGGESQNYAYQGLVDNYYQLVMDVDYDGQTAPTIGFQYDLTDIFPGEGNLVIKDGVGKYVFPNYKFPSSGISITVVDMKDSTKVSIDNVSLKESLNISVNDF